MRYGREALSKNKPQSQTQESLHGELCDDIYINFPSQQIRKELSRTNHFRFRHSPSPRSLKE